MSDPNDIIAQISAALDADTPADLLAVVPDVQDWAGRCVVVIGEGPEATAALDALLLHGIAAEAMSKNALLALIQERPAEVIADRLSEPLDIRLDIRLDLSPYTTTPKNRAPRRAAKRNR